MPDKGRESVKVMARRGRQQFGLFSFFVDILVSRNTALERREMEVTMLTHPHHCQSHSKGATLTLDEPLFANVLFQQLYLPRQRTMTTWVMLRCGHWKETCGYLQPSLGFPTCPFPINGSFEASGLRRHKSPSTPFSPSPGEPKENSKNYHARHKTALQVRPTASPYNYISLFASSTCQYNAGG